MPDARTVANSAAIQQADNAANVSAAIDQALAIELDKRPLRLLTDSDLVSVEPTGWLLKEVIPESSIGTLYGPSGTFKSFVALDLLAHVANGWTWMGKRVKQVPCVYVPFEGKGGIPKRVQAWRHAMAMRTKRPDPGNLGFRIDFEISTGITYITDPINLRDAADRKRLIQSLRDAGMMGCLICIDTLAQASAGIDENSSAMSEIIAALQELQRELNCVVLVVHHTGKDESRGMRGWSGIRGAMDFAIECQRADMQQRCGVIWLDKVKDGEDGRPLQNFSMEQIAIGVDEDGDIETSLVVAHTDGHAPEQYVQSDAQVNAAVDDFVWNWIRREINEGRRPSARSLASQLNEMRQQLGSIDKREHIRDAIDRLISAGRVEKAKHYGNPYLRTLNPISSTPPWTNTVERAQGAP